MNHVPFLSWQDTPNAKAPIAVVAVNFGADVNWRIQLRGGYHQNTIQPVAVVVDNTANSVAASFTVAGIANYVPANTRQAIPLTSDANYCDVSGTSGSINCQFFYDRNDVPPDLANYAGLISQAILAAIPTGVFWPYGGGVAPSGWLICDGSAVSRAVQANLFAVIGTQYGIGDGLTTFNLPDGRDRTFIGASPGALDAARPTARVIGASGGNENVALVLANLAAHTHNVTGNTGGQSADHTHGLGSQIEQNSGGGFTVAFGANLFVNPRDDLVTSGASSDHTHAINLNTDSKGAGTPFSVMNPFFVGTWIVKT